MKSIVIGQTVVTLGTVSIMFAVSYTPAYNPLLNAGIYAYCQTSIRNHSRQIFPRGGGGGGGGQAPPGGNLPTMISC